MMIFEDIVLKCILQVRKECNFFAALMMFAKIIKSEQTETAATDGINIYVNESFLQSLNSSEQNALLLHEVLHMALLHVSRSGNRDKYLWNVAADIVVNSLISRNTSFSIPEGAFVNPEFDDLSVEEIYEKLIIPSPKIEYFLSNLKIIEDLKTNDDNEIFKHEMDSEEIITYWRDKIEIVQRDFADASNNEQASDGQGQLPIGIDREISCILEPEVDWRVALWKFVAKTPSDFNDLDRRFIYRGLYLEGLITDSLNASVCIDTSGSVSKNLLTQFISELKAITKSYPSVSIDLFYADAGLDGPNKIDASSEIPKPTGGGGTSFKPFFNFIEKDKHGISMSENVSIYFTDGYVDFPSKQPTDPILWVVPSDGLESKNFPYGEVIRISTESKWD